MLREMNPVTAHMPTSRLRDYGTTLAACLLCRVLWPIVVQHRHLLFDCSSEANTLFINPKRSLNSAFPPPRYVSPKTVTHHCKHET